MYVLFVLFNRSREKKGFINDEEISYSCFGGVLKIPSVERFVSGVYQCDVETKLDVITMAEYVHVRGTCSPNRDNFRCDAI